MQSSAAEDEIDLNLTIEKVYALYELEVPYLIEDPASYHGFKPWIFDEAYLDDPWIVGAALSAKMKIKYLCRAMFGYQHKRINNPLYERDEDALFAWYYMSGDERHFADTWMIEESIEFSNKFIGKMSHGVRMWLVEMHDVSVPVINILRNFELSSDECEYGEIMGDNEDSTVIVINQLLSLYYYS